MPICEKLQFRFAIVKLIA